MAFLIFVAHVVIACGVDRFHGFQFTGSSLKLASGEGAKEPA